MSHLYILRLEEHPAWLWFATSDFRLAQLKINNLKKFPEI